MRRAAVIATLAILGALPACAATVDVFIGAMAPNGASGTDSLVGVGLDVPAGDVVTIAARLTRMGIRDGHAPGLTLAGEWPLLGVLYGTLGAGLTWLERGEVVNVTRDGCQYRAEVVNRDGSALHLQAGAGATIPAGRVGVTVEAQYRLPVHDGDGGIVGAVGVAIPLP